MDPAIVVALIGLVGSIIVAVLNHHLSGRVQTQERKIAQLYAMSMSEDLFRHLKNLSLDACNDYYVDPEMRYGLAPELNYLKMIGFIVFDRDPKAPDIAHMVKGDHIDLARYISVTKLGREFIALREEAMGKAR
jgi:hypothetical protein